MYPNIETETSYRYLQEVIKVLDNPICMLGGWAVFFHVNKNFQEQHNRPYLGSHDIDLGFHFEKDMGIEELKASPFGVTLRILEKDLNFRSINFRLLKEVHTETGKEITKDQHVPQHFIFPMYVDLIMDIIPTNFKEALKLNPIDEPLLQFVFKEEKFQSTKETLHKRLLFTRGYCCLLFLSWLQ